MFTSGAPDLQSLMQLLDAAQMGWWKADFRTGELFFSDYIVDLLKNCRSTPEISERFLPAWL